MIYDILAKTADPVGISGVVVLLTAYFLLSTNRLSSQSLKYQFCNLFGAVSVLYSLMFTFNLSSVVIEICWTIVSLIGIYRIVSDRKKENKKKVKTEIANNVVKLSDVKNKMNTQ